MDVGRAGGALLGARAVLFAAVSTALAATAHRITGGATPSGWVLLAAMVAMLEVGLLAGRTERRFGSVLAGLTAAQGGLHLFFDATAPLVHASGHVEPAGISASMTLAHAAATLAVAGWLRRGEAALWRLLRAAAVMALPMLPATPAPAPPDPPRASVLRPLRTPQPRAGRPGEVHRRGPPPGIAPAPAR